MRVGIGQINSHVGAMEANADRIVAGIGEARDAGCDLVVFPELAIPGYAPLDLVWRPGFVDACERAVERIRAASRGIGVVVGSIAAEPRREGVNRADLSSVADGAGIDLFNVAVVIDDARILARVAKSHLPCYDVHDEKRYFVPSPGVEVVAFRGTSLGIALCEDLWVTDGPIELQASLGAEWIINPSASPFYVGKPAIRRNLVAQRARENGVGIVYVNLVGGQDDVVFDGGSFVVGPGGDRLLQAPHFKEGLFWIDLDATEGAPETDDKDIEQLRDALVLGIRDYVRKNGFSSVLLGLSGGVDSAVVCTLAVDALGSESVTPVYLPSRFSSEESRADATELARSLSVGLLEIPISGIHSALRSALPDAPTGLTDENIQPRIRATIWMALANQRNELLLCAGNKSEIALGYNTLYGDTSGAIAPIADLYKSDVYAVAALYAGRIPDRIREKPPSAELRPNQRDEDDLPAYAVVDPLLRELIERNASRAQLVERGFDAATVDEVLRRYYTSEYKRRQLP
ncbi:NAD+ synthase, partial [Candidatus Bipolaricaulota bacterium]|nr:NAD+ synthase [Candidatus Bipolaricaulota bacterium]